MPFGFLSKVFCIFKCITIYVNSYTFYNHVATIIHIMLAQAYFFALNINTVIPYENSIQQTRVSSLMS